jgi:hypothetical protein
MGQVPQVKNTKQFLREMARRVQSAAISRGQTQTRYVTVDDEGVVKRYKITPRAYGSSASVEEV